MLGRCPTQVSGSWRNHMGPWVLALRKHRVLAAQSFDLCVWVVAFAVASWLRADLGLAGVEWGVVLYFGLVAGLAFLAAAFPTRLHQGRFATGSLEEVVLLGTT